MFRTFYEFYLLVKLTKQFSLKAMIYRVHHLSCYLEHTMRDFYESTAMVLISNSKNNAKWRET